MVQISFEDDKNGDEAILVEPVTPKKRVDLNYDKLNTIREQSNEQIMSITIKKQESCFSKYSNIYKSLSPKARAKLDDNDSSDYQN